jgi:DNA repair exonuclease SbcCD ATPase subunit
MAKNLDELLNKIDTKLDEMSDVIHKVDKDVALHKAAFEDHTKADEKMYDELRRMNDILQTNTESLKEHMHRTELLEDLVKKMDQRLSPIEEERIQIEAIKKYKHEKLEKIIQWGKILGVILTLIGITVAAKPLLLKLLLL